MGSRKGLGSVTLKINTHHTQKTHTSVSLPQDVDTACETGSAHAQLIARSQRCCASGSTSARFHAPSATAAYWHTRLV